MGRAWVEAALDRGDRVVATSRNVDDLRELVETFPDSLHLRQLDVTDRTAVLHEMSEASSRFGRLDFVVNNAATGHDGVVEDISEDDARSGMETSFFGALWVTQAAVRVMRPQNTGRIVQISTQGGQMAHAGLGIYHASKWALEGLTEALHHELVGTGVRTIIVEPGAALTEWFTRSLTRSRPNPAYDAVMATRFDLDPSLMPPARAIVDAALRAVTAADPPARILLTAQAFENVTETVRQRLAEWEEWEDLARSVSVG
ncbi:SDR family NAD(P)-dependent oxidoreductase [Curtobacterium sp. VKM Ac-2922]|nr:SDR family NAD(P)-dependent oxidoreductase [Curtobacterium sp. VKM Ac-2922]